MCSLTVHIIIMDLIIGLEINKFDNDDNIKFTNAVLNELYNQ